MKKILIFLVLILSIFSVSAGTTVLTSCGTPGGGWQDNEIYLLNFTTFSGECFEFDTAGTLTNITIRQIVPEITATGVQNKFIDLDGGASSLQYFTFEDINMRVTGTASNYFFPIMIAGGGVPGSRLIDHATFNNITFDRVRSFIYIYCANSQTNRIYNSTFDNIYVYGHESYTATGGIFEGAGGGATGATCRFGDNTISDSYLMHYNTDHQDSNPMADLTFTNSEITNSVIDNIGTFSEDIDVDSSIVYGKNNTDSNDDGNADTDPYTAITNGKIYIDHSDRNLRFLQDYEEGEPFFNKQGDDAHIPIEDGETGSPLTLTLQSPLDGSTMITNMTQASAFIVATGIDCSILDSEYCQFVNDPTTTSSSGNKFFNYINLQSNSHITNIETDIIHSGAGSVSASIMGNYLDVAYSSMNISGNNIVSSGNILLDTAFETISRPFVKVRVNSLTIEDNYFEYTFASVTGVGQFLYIDSLNPTTNKVYGNTFNNSVATPNTKSRVFEFQADTLFYDNCLTDNVITENSSLTNLNVTPYIGYLHTDDKIYYFYVGNYYEENTGCVDGDVDGFCDSSYTSGTATDTAPLASCGFDYTAHLLTADAVVDNNAFNIDLEYPTNNSDINVTGASSIVQFIFNHNSNFTDLTCDYYIDGAYVDTKTNPVKDVNQSIDVTGWTEKQYTWYVNCYNGFQDITSDEYIFNITIPATEGEESVDSIFGDSGITLFSTDTGTTADNLISFMALVETPMGYFAILAFVLMIFASIALIFGIIKAGLNSVK